MGECLIVKSDSGVDTSNATATYDTIVEGYSCYVNDELVVGNIPIQSIQNHINSDESIMLQSGYYAKNNTILVNSLENETLGNADFSTVLINNNGWVNGNIVVGGMLIQTLPTTFNPNDTIVIPKGWYNQNNTISQTLETQNSMTITPSSTDQILCDSGKWTIGDIVIVGDGNLVSSNIKNGVNIFGITGTFVGWIDSTWVGLNADSGNVYIYRSNINVFDRTFSGNEFSTLKKSFTKVTVWGWAWADSRQQSLNSYVGTTSLSGWLVNVSSSPGDAWSTSNSHTSAISTLSSLRVWGYIENVSGYGYGQCKATVTFKK